MNGDAQGNSNIFVYNFASKQSTQITHFTIEYALSFSISPDGQSIVFEHAAKQIDLVDLWMIDWSGNNMHALVTHAARPAWSRGTPQVPHNVYIPLVRR